MRASTPSLSLTLLLTLATRTALLARAQTYAPAFVGCFGNTEGTLVASSTAPSDGISCGTYCGNLAYPAGAIYSFYKASDATPCGCYQTPRTVNGYGGSADSNAVPPTCTNLYLVTRAKTTFDFVGCTNANIDTASMTADAVHGQSNDLSTAFAACGRYESIVVIPGFNPLKGNGQPTFAYQYYCGYTYSTTPDTCNYGNAYQFSHPQEDADALPSPYLRKRDRVARGLNELKRRQAKVQLCPPGLTPCRTGHSQVEGVFECLDTASEVESCGGCLHGEYIPAGMHVGANTTGIDCLALEGAAGAACVQGRCEYLGCDQGYILQSETCVPVRP